MSETHIFSTGVLSAFPGVVGSATPQDAQTVLSGASALVASRAINSGASYASNPQNIADGSAGTTAVINAHTGASPATSNDWFVIDMAQPYTIAQATVQITAQGSGTNTVNVWAADNNAAQPGGAGTTLLGTYTATVATTTITPALYVTGRYLLIESVNASASTITIAEVTVTVFAGIVFAVLQSVTATIQYQKKELLTASWVQNFPVDVGFYGGMAELQAEIAMIRADGLRKMIASTESGTSTLTETVTQVVALPAIAATLQTQSTDGKQQTWSFMNCRCPGATLTFKLDDYATSGFKFDAYPDSSGNVATFTIPQ